MESAQSQPALTGPKRPWWKRALYDTLSAATRIAFRVLYRTSVLHADRIPAHGGVLLVPNHESYLDPPLVGCFIRSRRITFVARVGLFSFRPLGWLIGALDALPVSADASDTASIRLFVQRLEAGGAVLIFPEGARTEDGTLGEFKRGVLLLIRKAGVPVVPIAVAGCFDAWPRSRKLPGRFGSKLGVAYGTPIPPEELMKNGPDAALARLRAEIHALKSELLEATGAGITAAPAAPPPASQSEGATRTGS